MSTVHGYSRIHYVTEDKRINAQEIFCVTLDTVDIVDKQPQTHSE